MEIIIHNIRSLHNVGAFFRNADAFGASHIYLTGYTATPPRVEISKTALGAEDTIKWTKRQDIGELIGELKSEGRRVIGFEANNEFKWLDQIDPDPDAILVFGNEPEGLSDKVLDMCTDRVYIPMVGDKTSINVSVASGVAMYAMSRKK